MIPSPCAARRSELTAAAKAPKPNPLAIAPNVSHLAADMAVSAISLAIRVVIFATLTSPTCLSPSTLLKSFPRLDSALLFLSSLDAAFSASLLKSFWRLDLALLFLSSLDAALASAFSASFISLAMFFHCPGIASRMLWSLSICSLKAWNFSSNKSISIMDFVAISYLYRVKKMIYY